MPAIFLWVFGYLFFSPNNFKIGCELFSFRFFFLLRPGCFLASFSGYRGLSIAPPFPPLHADRLRLLSHFQLTSRMLIETTEVPIRSMWIVHVVSPVLLPMVFPPFIAFFFSSVPFPFIARHSTFFLCGVEGEFVFPFNPFLRH